MDGTNRLYGIALAPDEGAGEGGELQAPAATAADVELSPDQIEAMLAGSAIDLSGTGDGKTETKPDDKTSSKEEPAAQAPDPYKQQVETLVNQFMAMDPAEQQRYIQVLQGEAPAQTQQTASRISDIDVESIQAMPAAAIEAFEKALGEDGLSEEGKLMFKGLVAMNKQMASVVNSLSSELASLKGSVMPVTAQVQNARDAQMLTQMGYAGVTEQTVEALRRQGTSNPVATYQTIMGSPRKEAKPIPPGMDASSQKRTFVDVDKIENLDGNAIANLLELRKKGVELRGKNAHLIPKI